MDSFTNGYCKLVIHSLTVTKCINNPSNYSMSNYIFLSWSRIFTSEYLYLPMQDVLSNN